VHPRLAGALLSRNTDAVKYPCYRIVLSSGGIGGYSGDGGIGKKKALLKKDGIVIKNNKIDLRKYMFEF
jgi:alkylated DNA nucleotide flippase Atl1